MAPCPEGAGGQRLLHTFTGRHMRTQTRSHRHRRVHTGTCAHKNTHPHRGVHTRAPVNSPTRALALGEHEEEPTRSQKRKFLGAADEEMLNPEWVDLTPEMHASRVSTRAHAFKRTHRHTLLEGTDPRPTAHHPLRAGDPTPGTAPPGTWGRSRRRGARGAEFPKPPGLARPRHRPPGEVGRGPRLADRPSWGR